MKTPLHKTPVQGTFAAPNERAQTMELSIIIPAYNEGKKITRDIRAAVAFLNKENIAGEVLVVDDGSKDDTVAQVNSLLDECPQLRLLTYGRNFGKGYAVRFGMQHSKGQFALFADAGLCVPYEMALVGLTYLKTDMCDIAIANRRLGGSLVAGQKLYRLIGSRLNSWIVRLFMGIPWHLTDTQCGFKLFKGSIARELYATVKTDRMMADIEMLLRAVRAKHRILNFAVAWTNDPDTRFNPTWGQLRNFYELFQIKVALWKA
jgi:dolichyl-phosphate beta-glucosyltransferase